MSRITLEKIKIISKALKVIGEKVLFVGGSAAQFYVDSSMTKNIRFTKDIDIVFEIFSLIELERLRQKLIDNGFKESFNNKVLCRFLYQDIPVDVMSVLEIGWAPGNEWFESGFAKAEKRVFENTEILILPLSYYLATKFAAFLDRGVGDPYLSQDLEDIVYLLDNNSDFHKKLLINDDENVRCFLKKELKRLIETPKLKEALTGHLPFYFQEKSIQRIQKNILLYLNPEKNKNS